MASLCEKCGPEHEGYPKMNHTTKDHARWWFAVQERELEKQ